ncbi:hypothetical protein IV203_014473 [Nitzschia inconspicua]|uniref:F-box domain-containing protein n=1 Tax=Nitzschia inconspicua TaxID=303405 RepID=A0A9K3LBV8_9STRA|nr:hypothetical protein IV203_014473 [Nitzschia inconspicua]
MTSPINRRRRQSQSQTYENHDDDDDDDKNNGNSIGNNNNNNSSSSSSSRSRSSRSRSRRTRDTTTTSSSSSIYSQTRMQNQNQNQNKASSNTNTVASVVDSFRATPLVIHRQQLRQALYESFINEDTMSRCYDFDFTVNASKNTIGTMIKEEEEEESQKVHSSRIFNRQRNNQLSTDLCNLNWKALCQDHDTKSSKSTTITTEEARVFVVTTKTTTTTIKTVSALSELLQALKDPTILPFCVYQNRVVPIVMKALLQSPPRASRTTTITTTSTTGSSSSRWTPSQQLLLQDVLSCRCHQHVYNFIQDYSFTTPNPANRLVSSISFWTMSVQPHQQYQPASETAFYYYSMAGVRMVQKLDDWDIQQQYQQQQQYEQQQHHRFEDTSTDQTFQHNIYCTCGQSNYDNDDDPSSSKRRKVVSTTLNRHHMDDLHDGTTDIHYNNSISTTNRMSQHSKQQRYYNYHRWTQQQQQASHYVSVKDVMNDRTSTTNRTDNNNNKNNNNNHLPRTTIQCQCHTKMNRNNSIVTFPKTNSTMLSKDWSIVRTRAYKKFVTLVQQQHHHHQLVGGGGHTTINSATMMVISSSSSVLSSSSSSQRSLLPLPFQPLNNLTLLHEIAQWPASPSLRVCLLLVAHTTNTHLHIANLCWTMYESNTHNTIWLRIYAEWLGDCRHPFDDDPKLLWQTLHPLRMAIQALIQQQQQQQQLHDDDGGDDDIIMEENRFHKEVTSDSQDDDEKNDINVDNTAHKSKMISSKRKAELLHCFGYIWMRRSHLFRRGRRMSDNNDDDDDTKTTATAASAESFMNLLSVHLGDCAKLWLQKYSHDDDNFDLTLATLQRWHILGVTATSELDDDHDGESRALDEGIDEPSTVNLRLKALSSWPFHPSCSLRAAVGRIESTVLCLDNNRGIKDVSKILLSPTHLFLDDYLDDNPNRTDTVHRRRQDPSVPITDYIHDEEIYCHIFSFCSPKRIGKLQQVCRLWNSTIESRAESVWKDAYVARFGAYRLSPMMSTNDGLETPKSSWKNLFYHKYIAERSIRRQRHAKTGYPFRTCPYVGCFHVMKSEQQERLHLGKHEREVAKQKRKGNKGNKPRTETPTAKKRKRKFGPDKRSKIGRSDANPMTPQLRNQS